MINTGFELCGVNRCVQSVQHGYHKIALNILRAGLDVIGNECECSVYAAKIAASHMTGQEWGSLVNDALMAAHFAGPFDSHQWIARAAAKITHGPSEVNPVILH